MLNEFNELVWIVRQVGDRWSDDDQWRAVKIAMASLRKMLNVESFLRMMSPMKPLENLGTQNPSPSLLASDQISSSAVSAAHSSASNRQTPSRRCKQEKWGRAAPKSQLRMYKA